MQTIQAYMYGFKTQIKTNECISAKSKKAQKMSHNIMKKYKLMTNYLA